MADIVALSKPISLDLLNEVYEEFIAGLSKQESKEKLDEIISQKISSKDNIRKTRTIVQNLWYVDSDWFHEEAASVARYLTRIERLPIHWALLMNYYRLFTDMCTVLGQLFEIKDAVSATQIKSEIYSKWGARNTLDASLSKTLKSLRDMEALAIGGSKTSYAKVMHTVFRSQSSSASLCCRNACHRTTVHDLGELHHTSHHIPVCHQRCDAS